MPDSAEILREMAARPFPDGYRVPDYICRTEAEAVADGDVDGFWTPSKLAKRWHRSKLWTCDLVRLIVRRDSLKALGISSEKALHSPEPSGNQAGTRRSLDDATESQTRNQAGTKPEPASHDAGVTCGPALVRGDRSPPRSDIDLPDPDPETNPPPLRGAPPTVPERSGGSIAEPVETSTPEAETPIQTEAPSPVAGKPRRKGPRISPADIVVKHRLLRIAEALGALQDAQHIGRPGYEKPDLPAWLEEQQALCPLVSLEGCILEAERWARNAGKKGIKPNPCSFLANWFSRTDQRLASGGIGPRRKPEPDGATEADGERFDLAWPKRPDGSIDYMAVIAMTREKRPPKVYDEDGLEMIIDG